MELNLKLNNRKRILKNIPIENPFDFTEYVKKQTEGDDIDLGLFLGIAKENKIIYNQTSKQSHRRYEKIDKWLFLQKVFLVKAMMERSILSDCLQIVMN